VGAVHGFVTWAVALIAAFSLPLVVVPGLFTAIVFESAENATTNGVATASPRPAEAEHGGRIARDYAVGAGWSWFGRWLIAAITAIAAGVAGSRGSLQRKEREAEPLEIDRRAHRTPLTLTTAP
jgi:hypothetical protein